MTTTTHRRPLRLPGQAAAHEGPVDMSVMYLMHHAFRRDLHAFAEVVPLTPVEDRETWRALAARWELFSAPLHHHHTGEDTWLWPFLMDRATESEQATLEAMEAEHAEIDPGLAACAAGFARLADHADEDARAGLAVRLCAVREALARHLRHEESDTIALLQRVMTQDEWEQIDKELVKGVTFPFLLRTIPWVMHGVPAEAREHVFASSGLAHRVLWRLTRPRFERLHARAFRYAP
ncbi:MAG TPA: hemerythrin domain-containing protein [Marmoricola sp.]|nr:hemerythrin domain-containing protein [Marmoricola sp.]